MKKSVMSVLLVIPAALALTLFLTSCGGGGGGGSEDNGGEQEGVETSEGGDGDSSGSGRSHNAGTNCGLSGCHSGAVEADKRYTYAGTVYTDATASAPAAGAVVVITDSSGTWNLTTDQSGNFYTLSGSPGGGYSATVQGNSVAMVQRPTAGFCASDGCHGSGAAHVFRN